MAQNQQNPEEDDLDIQIPDIGGIDDFGDLDTSLFDILPEEESGSDGETRYIKPKVRAGASSDDNGIYKSAEDLARKLRLWNGDRYDCLVNGDFIFGDFIEAFMAAEQLGRRCFMVEYDPRYADVIVKRWEELTGKQAAYIGNILDQEAAAETPPPSNNT